MKVINHRNSPINKKNIFTKDIKKVGKRYHKSKYESFNLINQINKTLCEIYTNQIKSNQRKKKKKSFYHYNGNHFYSSLPVN
ncbi:hypothetical protein Phum_PHUM383880 [Pediculus humanus corporis]|uniref:Uncharacterized protein n=1 Tax=Pediculus humanus subsp. corporis TaxID=121224 RepID=E0VQS8_PEDHC|nr:uncharacterized protein Phum_PHUM383880 [Pediculus humanus corporis]EEB15734.1 hypothetical protein Phum_PHUM383880 [Pediculus humanus corporis]